ncbi:MAG TPA: VCBS repeat-containing protein, partial [Bryobacteraceae bacterium]|nr:VCBS repeat-containing protein [Bryobacteraceae bacterium]
MVLIWLLALTAMNVAAQGVATRNVPVATKPPPSGIPFHASFIDIAREAGLTAPYVLGEPGPKKYIIEANGSGAAFVDFDNDGNLDIFLVNGSRLRPFKKGEEPTSHLYRGDGKGRFADVTTKAGVGRAGWGNGVCSGDIDNDGFEDLYVTYWGPNSLWRNKGNGSFEDIAAKAGVAGPRDEWSTGCTFIDYDRDGYLDLFVSSYLQFDLKTAPMPGQHPWCMFKDKPVFCGPRGLPHGTVSLYRNKGDGSFVDVSVVSGVRSGPPCYAFTATAADLNGDGWTDIYVACDSTPSLFLRNNRDGTFSEIGIEAGVAFDEHGAEQAGMGVAIADFDSDGWLDLTKTNFALDYPNLYRNIGKGIFEDTVLAAGAGVNTQYVLWGTGLEDLD